MFDVENVVRQIELSDANSICVVGEHRSGKHEILELSLPDKITVSPGQEGLVKNSDLKMRSGGYTTAPVVQMKTLWNQKKILVSLDGQPSASIYNLGSEESDLISRENTLKCDLVSPFLAVNNKGLVLLTTKGKTDVAVINIDQNQQVYKRSISGNEAEVWLEPCFVSESLAALCNRYTGSMTLQDVRSGESCATLSRGGGSKTEELWTLGVSKDGKKLGQLSRAGKLVIYDVRSPATSCHSFDIGKVCDSDKLDVPALEFSTDSSDVISVSGFDDKVYVFSTGDQLRNLFVHDGHKHQSGSVGDSFVTCHVWYKDRTVISSSLNSSLHCWQFIPQTL